MSALKTAVRLLLTLVLLSGVGCFSIPSVPKSIPSEARKANRENLSQIRTGLTKSEVFKIMGYPQVTGDLFMLNSMLLRSLISVVIDIPEKV